MTKKEISKITHTTFNMEGNNKTKVIEMAAKEHIPFTSMLNKVIDAGLAVMEGTSSNVLTKASIQNMFKRTNDDLQHCLALVNSLYIYLAMSINKVPPTDYVVQARDYLEKFNINEFPIDSVTRAFGGDSNE